MHLTNFMNHPGIKKYPLREGRLARIDVRGDPDIPGALKHMLTVWTVWIHEGGPGLGKWELSRWENSP